MGPTQLQIQIGQKDRLQIPLEFRIIQLQVCLHHPRQHHQLQIFGNISFRFACERPRVQSPASPPFRIFGGTLKYNDANKNVNFVIISSPIKQCVCLLPSRIFTREYKWQAGNRLTQYSGLPQYIHLWTSNHYWKYQKYTTPMPNLDYRLQHATISPRSCWKWC